MREGITNIDLDTLCVSNFVDKDVSTVHVGDESGRHPGSDYIETRETHFGGIGSGGDPGV